jgi:predicted DNA-binding transcriptional regulator AlpA
MDQTEIAETAYRIAHSPKSAAAAAGVGRNKIYKWMNDGSLPAKKDNGRTIIPDDALRTKIASLPNYEPAGEGVENA